MFGFFEPPRLKVQKAAAKSGRLLRELLGRELTVELQMVASRIRWADNQRYIALDHGQTEIARQIAVVAGAGQEFMTRFGYGVDAVIDDVAQRWATATTADQFEALAAYELELRNGLLKLRDEARGHVSAIGEQAMTVTHPT